jgi:hypothetical protein
MGDVLTKAYDEYAECEKVLSSSAPSHPIANGQKIWNFDGTGPVVGKTPDRKWSPSTKSSGIMRGR